jgi:death on curing protein
MIYPNSEQILETYKNTITVSGGGASGILKPGCIESIVEFIKNDDYYPAVEDKLSHLVFSVNKNHCFQDGNKRMAISLGGLFLLLNGYVFIVSKFISEMENISYHVAAGIIDKDLLKRLIYSIIYEPDFDESLKLELLNKLSEPLSEEK